MPQIRKLSVDEVKTIERRGKSQRRIIEEQYDTMLQEFAIGDYGEVDLDSGEKRLTVRNRLRAAAKRHTVGLQFMRMKGDLLRFRVVDESEDDTAKASPALVIPVAIPVPSPIAETPAAPTAPRRGRPKKEVVPVEPMPTNGRRGRRRKVEA